MQDDIKNFRFKLPVILWDSRLNKIKEYQEPEQEKQDRDSPSDVEMIENPVEVAKQSDTTHQIESDISPCVLSSRITSTSTQELLCAIVTYIMTINDAESLE